MSENRYASATRAFFAGRMNDLPAISPPADYTLATAWTLGRYFMFNIPPGTLNPESNIKIHRLGVFANFADGFVFKNAYENIDLSIFVNTCIRQAPLADTISWSDSSPVVTGAGGVDFTVEFVPGQIIYLDTNIPSPQRQRQYAVIDTVDGAAQLTLTQYPWTETSLIAAGTISKLSQFTGDEFPMFRLPALNVMFDVGEVMSPLGWGAQAGGDDTLIYVEINGGRGEIDAYGTPHDTVFLTKSISTSFDGDAVDLNIAADIEFTPAP